MKIHNTLTRQKETLKPLKPGHISFYSCGPTVYHYYHIGNLRNAVFNDTLKRALIAAGFKVDHVMNITDVGHLSSDADTGEDKLQSRAAEEGKTVWEVAQFYTDAFMKDMGRLNVIDPSSYVKATDRIDAQIKMVETLLVKGYAYKTDQAVYFDVRKLDDYGKLTGQKLSDKEVGVRDEVVVDSEKRNPQDFALWFFTVGHFKDHEMRWSSPWGEGFPGWHLECSAIIESELGETIDIHTGGVDHIGTHHTNEIAQSEAAHGKPLANYWMHNEFLMVDGSKISKSLKNGYRLDELIEKGYDPLALRLLFLQSHYRTQQNFTFEGLEAAQNLLKRFRAWSDWQFQDGASTLADDVFGEYYEQIVEQFKDDLNTPQAIATFNSLVDHCDNQNALPTSSQVSEIEQLFGLQLDQRTDISEEQKAVIAEREGARKAKDYEASDKARKKLADEGITVEDTEAGPRWSRA